MQFFPDMRRKKIKHSMERMEIISKVEKFLFSEASFLPDIPGQTSHISQAKSMHELNKLLGFQQKVKLSCEDNCSHGPPHKGK